MDEEHGMKVFIFIYSATVLGFGYYFYLRLNEFLSDNIVPENPAEPTDIENENCI